MNECRHVSTILGMTAVCCLGLLLVLGAGCKKEPEKPAPAEAAEGAVKFVNVRCPVMDTPIDPAKVPESLTRLYKGEKVAFCCAGCPAGWDKLSDAEKDAKLAKVRPTEGE